MRRRVACDENAPQPKGGGLVVCHKSERAADVVMALIAEQQSTMTPDEWRYFLLLMSRRIGEGLRVEVETMSRQIAAEREAEANEAAGVACAHAGEDGGA